MLHVIFLFIIFLLLAGLVYALVSKIIKNSPSIMGGVMDEEIEENVNELSEEEISTTANNYEAPNSTQITNTTIDPNKKYTKKEQAKLLKKKEKEEQRNYMKMLQEEKKMRQLEKEKEQKIREMKREEERRIEEELVQKLKEEEEKKENDIYNRWKDQIIVGEEGEEGGNLEDENMINDFIEYIKLRKTVSLEDLAGVFKINPTDLVERLKSLEDQGRIVGIIDDRGKYIYITDKELASIEKIFMTRGRISKSDLIKECNKIIRFVPTEEDKLKIKEEQNKILKTFEDELGNSSNNTSNK